MLEVVLGFGYFNNLLLVTADAAEVARVEAVLFLKYEQVFDLVLWLDHTRVVE